MYWHISPLKNVWTDNQTVASHINCDCALVANDSPRVQQTITCIKSWTNLEDFFWMRVSEKYFEAYKSELSCETGFCSTNPATGPFPTPLSISHLKRYTWTAWQPENVTLLTYMTRILQQMIWSQSSDRDIDFSLSLKQSFLPVEGSNRSCLVATGKLIWFQQQSNLQCTSQSSWMTLVDSYSHLLIINELTIESEVTSTVTQRSNKRHW